MSTIRVRFAPSPTGYLHIGGLRTAYFNWLFARHNKGSFLLRIEDTDVERSSDLYTKAILNDLSWAKLDSDEPLVFQSHRTQRYQDVIQKLLEEKKAYYCYCTPEELRDRLGDEHQAYDRACCTKPCINKPAVVRFKIPDSAKTITFNDLVYGPITIDKKQLHDFIIARTDGMPTYNFAVVVDDADMGISHVIRGEDHLSNTPKQILLYEACSFPLPQFAHLPMILGPEGNRLSKRDAATSVGDYKKEGFLAESLLNYLVRLGWSHGDQELFSREELILLFTLKGVGKKGSIFDIQKLRWVNSQYLAQSLSEYLLEYLNDQFSLNTQVVFSKEQLKNLIDLYKVRVATLGELYQEIISLSQAPRAESFSVVDKQEAKLLLGELRDHIEKINPFNEETIKNSIKLYAEHNKRALSTVLVPLRLSLTGTLKSPGIYQLMAILGKHLVQHKIDNALPFLS